MSDIEQPLKPKIEPGDPDILKEGPGTPIRDGLSSGVRNERKNHLLPLPVNPMDVWRRGLTGIDFTVLDRS